MKTTIRVKADIHIDGDVYVYGKDKIYHRVGILIPDNIKGFIFDEKGYLISAPMNNPCFKKTLKLTTNQGGVNIKI